jgi:uncharacterized lipoprotein YmbA
MASMTRRLLMMALLLGASGCASANPELYTLASIPGPEVDVPQRRIVMRAVNVARYLERPEIVRWSEDYQLNVRANAWWGEPLSPMIGRVLIDELSQRAQRATIFPENSGISASADATLEITIQRMDADRAGTVQLRAQVVLIPTGTGRAPRFKTVRLQTVPTGGDIRAEVAAISTALGLLADEIAQLLRR